MGSSVTNQNGDPFGGLEIELGIFSWDILFYVNQKPNICPYQLGNKFPKETILNIWRNEKYFSDLLIYQLFGYNLAKIQLPSS